MLSMRIILGTMTARRPFSLLRNIWEETAGGIQMITYNSIPVAGKHVGLHAVTLEDSNPYEVIYHVRRWMNMIDDKREIDIQNITQIADDRRVYTTIWYTEVAQ